MFKLKKRENIQSKSIQKKEMKKFTKNIYIFKIIVKG